MPKFTPSTIAASIALLGLGAIGGYAASSGQDAPSTAAAPVEIRTQIHRRVIHVTRHEKARRPRHPEGVRHAGRRAGTSLVASAARTGAGVQTRTSGGSGSATSGSLSGGGSSGSGSSGGRHSPVRTRSSSGGSSSGGSGRKPAAKRPAPHRSAPVRTHSSGGGSSHPTGSGHETEHETEHEHGDD